MIWFNVFVKSYTPILKIKVGEFVIGQHKFWEPKVHNPKKRPPQKSHFYFLVNHGLPFKLLIRRWRVIEFDLE